jgi:CRP/FNR family cyclic AMP-dependent transcriptional regulator
LVYARSRVNVAELLTRSDLFSAFDADALDRVADSSRECTLRRNELVFSEGDEANDLYVVVSGRIAIANRSIDGRESVLALMEEGDLFGDMPLFDGDSRSADARALEPSVLLAVAYPPIREILESRPHLLWEVVSLLARRLRSTDAALADSVFLDVPGRTAKRLLELAGEADEFALPVTQEELAGMVGASRERVNKAIAAFVRLGWIEQSERRYRILNRQQLTIRAR